MRQYLNNLRVLWVFAQSNLGTPSGFSHHLQHFKNAFAFLRRISLAMPTRSSQNGRELIELSDPRDSNAIKQLMKPLNNLS